MLQDLGERRLGPWDLRVALTEEVDYLLKAESRWQSSRFAVGTVLLALV